MVCLQQYPCPTEQRNKTEGVGTYFGKFSAQVMEFTRNNLPSEKRVFLINTYGARRASIKNMEKIIKDKSCALLGTYGCRGFDTFGPLKHIGGIAKGRPNENDLKEAREFFRRVTES